jgi:hypothetical protein
MKIKMKKNKLIRRLKIIVGGFTLAKFLGAISTIIIVALIKYTISGNLNLDYSDFVGNVYIGLIGWTLNTGLMGMLTEYLGLKGINFNLHQFIFGLDTMKMDGASTPEISKPRHKLYNTMDADDESGNTPSDKGKSVDREVHPFYTGDQGSNKGVLAGDTQDKGKVASVDPFSVWARIFPGADRINPGPGFNVPGGNVPIGDEICKHIDYNGYILRQFKNMDLETARTQRDNNLAMAQVLENKIAYAQEAIAKIPLIPRTEAEFNLKTQIQTDLDTMSNTKTRAEARATLINSRVEFIESQMNNRNN